MVRFDKIVSVAVVAAAADVVGLQNRMMLTETVYMKLIWMTFCST